MLTRDVPNRGSGGLSGTRVSTIRQTGRPQEFFMFLRMILILASLFPTLALAATAENRVAASQPGGPEQSLFADAKKAYESGDYRKALDLSNSLAARYPKSPLIPETLFLIVDSRVRLLKQSQPPQKARPSGNGDPAKTQAPGPDASRQGSPPASPAPPADTKGGGGAAGDESRGEALKLDFRSYLALVIRANPSYRIEREEMNRAFATFMTSLQGYGFNLNFVPSFSAYYDDGMQYGTDIRLELRKTLYDWGKKGILEQEAELVKSLGEMNLMAKRDALVMAAAGYYAAFSYSREEYSLLEQRFREHSDFMRRMENAYQKGQKISSYEYYSAKSYNLRLERDLLNKRAELLKTETAFRQFGHVYADRRIRLAPLSLHLSSDLETLEREAVARSSAIRAARLGNQLQQLAIREKRAERMGSIDFNSSVGVQVGTPKFAGENNLVGTGSQPVVTVGITATIPLLDGGVRKTRVLVEEIEALKRRLSVQKETEEVVRRLTEIYADYQALEKNREITDELLAVTGKRLGIAKERFEKGLEEYRSVREAWDDSLLTEMEHLRQKAVLQKLLVDIQILSGRKSAELCPAE